MDLTKVSKQLCENISVAFTEEYFVMAMIAGDAGQAYALTPQHMKRLSQYLAYQIAEYEKLHGEIKTQWMPGVESPIQMSGGSAK